ncbi:malonate decarboxylase holo-(acyl-carrier-protein) synthase [Burkholderia sp. Ch1-1]|uniref:Phosphoribosyl-dephospho-CoA transferase n=1 Tax=Paraburkholderia dioscoreae TaxID=2604047 RepID=A0A5Q4ZKZ2_9BURK|nr:MULTISPECIES: malonate decarboxylase holo-ACP synthase [Paraburkholderia]EIF33629.1 malonate decarboxylase holo-(acyl-carrier-protein) synthase [Burkholderia sp. Ch1-1]MDR8399628.1 malonate decarboxylase holo-ACP synthase [Paraburkholderia sp. USG1]VVD32497.1 Phosphoribosyl-dephospho-CoA transferase [Paraburkholderia dioscoreae]
MQACAAPPFAIDHALSCDARWRPHDLLRLQRLQPFDAEPAWVRDAFGRAPYAVVRRALAADGFVAIGVRGAGRSQRYATWALSADVVTAVSPETLASRAPLAARTALPAFAALAALQDDVAGPLGAFVWGPTGSAGFELATQTPTVTASSDLDLLIRAYEKPLARNLAIQLQDYLQALAQRAGVRVDAQLDTPAGGVALAEWAAGKPRVMARHASGPCLIPDPWATAAHGDNA